MILRFRWKTFFKVNSFTNETGAKQSLFLAQSTANELGRWERQVENITKREGKMR